MPIYIVRWADCSASIIRADNERHLQLMLDEVGDPAEAVWEEYDGPLWIELEPIWRQVEDTVEIADEHFNGEAEPCDVLPMGVATSEASSAMYWTILARLFPHIYLTLQSLLEIEASTEEAKARIVEAFRREEWLEVICQQYPRHESTPEEFAKWADLLDGAQSVERDLDAELEQAKAVLREGKKVEAAKYARLHAERQQALAHHLGSKFGDDGGESDD